MIRTIARGEGEDAQQLSIPGLDRRWGGGYSPSNDLDAMNPSETSPAPSDRGILLAVEGIDGAGKTTQVGLLAHALESAGIEVITSKEPTKGYWGRRIRKSAENGRMPPGRELLTFIQDRQQHAAQKILPSLEQGKIVILDRYFYSTIAYQGERGLPVEWLDRQLRDLAPTPDLVLVLDVHPALGMSRIVEERGDTPNHFERVDSLARIREIFQDLCKYDPVLVEVDGSMSAEAVHAVILGKLLAGPLRAKRCAKSYGCNDPAHCIPRMTSRCEWVRLYKSITAGLDARYRGLMDDPYSSEHAAAAG